MHKDPQSRHRHTVKPQKTIQNVRRGRMGPSKNQDSTPDDGASFANPTSWKIAASTWRWRIHLQQLHAADSGSSSAAMLGAHGPNTNQFAYTVTKRSVCRTAGSIHFRSDGTSMANEHKASYCRKCGARDGGAGARKGEDGPSCCCRPQRSTANSQSDSRTRCTAPLIKGVWTVSDSQRSGLAS